MISFRPATAEAVQKVYGCPQLRSMRGVVFEDDGEPVACAGLYTEAGHQVLFFDGDHARVRAAPVTAVKAAKHLLELAARAGTPVLAHALEEAEKSERFLQFLGFTKKEGRVYQWHGQR